MEAISTITTKGQVVIPQIIRDFFGLKPSDKLLFQIENHKIVAKPILTIDKAMGIVKAKGMLSKKRMKQIIASRIVEKYKKT